MKTATKKRINLSVSGDINNAIQKLARRDNVPTATKALELIKKAVAIEEDDVLDMLARERDTASARYLSHRHAWK